ncbi:MAG: glycosyltransferase, partial [Campylobacterota bacterium]|nr:glycosyltransferase [Campylobacterota bacterium]
MNKKQIMTIVKPSEHFDEEYYLKHNQDAGDSHSSALEHYCKVGIHEDRKPNELFDPIWYREHYEDVKADGAPPLVHYILFGEKENRLVNSSQKEEYEEKELPQKQSEEVLHEEVSSKNDDNNYNTIKNSKYFNQDYYLSVNSDVAELGCDPVEHYLKYGYKEERNPSEMFNNDYYIDKYHDIKENDINPLLHYIEYGQEEGRTALPTQEEAAAIPLKATDIYRTDKNSHKIDILIPVYNGIEYLEPLFQSIIKNTLIPYRLLVCDDKSPNKDVFPLLESIKNRAKNVEIELLKNETNLGFVGTVNRLFSLTRNHFVVLNTDTEVPPSWLERLMSPIINMKNIATTTPFTNAGTICSFPNYLEDNEHILNNMSVDKIDSYFQNINFEKTYIEIPTGVGFCMGVNKELADEIGMFDTIFGKGYGEENDFCQRAIEKGFKNIHVTNLFVYHKHGGSFPSETKKMLVEKNLKLLNQKHPTYDTQVQKTIQENQLEALREQMYFSIVSHDAYSVLYIDHNLGGGAVDYRKMEIEKRVEKNELIILLTYVFHKTNSYIVECIHGDKHFKYSCQNLEDLFALLSSYSFNEIFLNSLVSYPNLESIIAQVRTLHNEKHTKLIVPIHDFFPLCPSYTLLNDKREFCNIPSDKQKCYECLNSNLSAEYKQFSTQTDINSWRIMWSRVLEISDEILCFSNSSKDIFSKAYPLYTEKVIVTPHDISGRYDKIYEPFESDKKRVGILGGINIAKGAYIIKDLVEHIERNNLNAEVILIGEIEIEISSPVFHKTGRYKRDELPSLVKDLKITEFLIPSIWPETFSYTTDEIMQLGYPLTVFDIGAP